MSVVTQPESITSLLHEYYSDVFEEGLGIIAEFQANLAVRNLVLFLLLSERQWGRSLTG